MAILVTAGATLAVTGRALLAPLPIERPPIPVVLPTSSPLPEWEPVADENRDPDLPITTRFRRAHGDLSIEMEMQYIPNLPVHYIRDSMLELRFLPRGHLPLDAGMRFYLNSRNRIITNRRDESPIDALIEPCETSARSAHGIWAADQRLHLSAIITPDGDTAMLTQVVARHMYLDHLSLRRLAQWLLGRRTLPDRRCVLVHFSISESAPTPQESRRLLEVAWSDWQRGFQPVFPQ